MGVAVVQPRPDLASGSPAGLAPRARDARWNRPDLRRGRGWL